MRNIKEITAKIDAIRGKVAAAKANREERGALIESLGHTENDWNGYETAAEIREFLKTPTGKKILEESQAGSK